MKIAIRISKTINIQMKRMIISNLILLAISDSYLTGRIIEDLQEGDEQYE